MKKCAKKVAYLPSNHVQLVKYVILRHLGMLGFMGKIGSRLVLEFLQWWVLQSKIFGQKSTYSKDTLTNEIEQMLLQSLYSYMRDSLSAHMTKN